MAAAKKTASKTTHGVFDVSKPGAPAVASATSRPIIIKHPTIQDPMVNSNPTPDAQPTTDEPAETETAPILTSPSAKKIVIQPLHDSVDETPAETPVGTPPAPEEPAPEPAPEAPEPKAEPKPEAKPEPAPPAVSETGTASSDKPVIDDEKQAADRSAKIAQLVASEEYFLPIETLEQRRSKQAAILGILLIVLLLLAWYDVALDANLLSNTYKLPHTSFFSAK